MTTKNAQLTIGSMFSGYGGLDLAIEQVTGAKPKWFIEFDEAPSKILAHHWPGVPNLGDVTKVDWHTVPKVDIIAGGSPCQDLSAAGKRAGMTDGTRSNLWVNMREAIEIIRPRLVVWENVLGALSATAKFASDLEPTTRPVGDSANGHLRALGRVLGDLTEIGYDARWTTLRVSELGGHTTEHESSSSPHLPTPKAGDGIMGRPRTSGRPIEKSTHLTTIVTLLPTPNTMDSLPAREGEARERQLRRGDPNGSRRASMGNLREDIVEAVQHLPTPNARDGNGGGAQPPDKRRAGGHQVCLTDAATIMGNIDNTYGRYTPAVRRWERVTRPAPPPTELNSKNKPRLSAPFAEWLMGLPAGWVTAPEIGLTRAQQLKAIGNGVCPQQAIAALKHLLRNQEHQPWH